MNELYTYNEPATGHIAPPEIKELGIFETTNQTLDTLVEIKNMLNIFRSDIGDGQFDEKFGPCEAHNFRESVEIIRMLSTDIQSDLKSLISRFR